MALKEIVVPDMGGFSDVAIAEVYVSAGDVVEVESSLISLESDKAVMDIPSPYAGKIAEVKVAAGGTVSAGDVIALIETDAVEGGSAGADEGGAGGDGGGDAGKETAESGGARAGGKAVPGTGPDEKEIKSGAADAGAAAAAGEVSGSVKTDREVAPSPGADTAAEAGAALSVHATPSVRILARKLGVDLSQVKATGPKGRILKEDLYEAVSGAMEKHYSTASGRAAPGGGASGSFSGLPSPLPPVPVAEFLKEGEVEEVSLSRIKKISGKRVHQHWLGIPQVTHCEEADVTALEEFRLQLNSENRGKELPKLTILPFVIKALSDTLKKFPDFNSSLDPEKGTIIRKKYYNIGFAVDTPEGLLVPVIRDADKKGVFDIAAELSLLSSRAREGKLDFSDLRGSTFSVSSLGGIGGTSFSPIVNHPEAAILGLSKISVKPVWNGAEFEPRSILPFSVSYDHRIIDGARCAWFAKYLSGAISDIRRIIL